MIHFEHIFKGSIHTTSGSFFTGTFGDNKFAEKPAHIACKGDTMEIIEEVGLTTRKQLEIDYGQVSSFIDS